MKPSELLEELDSFLSKHYPHPNDRDDLFVSEVYDLLLRDEKEETK